MRVISDDQQQVWVEYDLSRNRLLLLSKEQIQKDPPHPLGVLFVSEVHIFDKRQYATWHGSYGWNGEECRALSNWSGSDPFIGIAWLFDQYREHPYE